MLPVPLAALVLGDAQRSARAVREHDEGVERRAGGDHGPAHVLVEGRDDRRLEQRPLHAREADADGVAGRQGALCCCDEQ